MPNTRLISPTMSGCCVAKRQQNSHTRYRTVEISAFYSSAGNVNQNEL